MDILKAIILGIVQGLTEFLPVSSSGHLEIVNHFMNSSSRIDSDLTMVIITHLGTALSIVYVFRDDILSILKSLVTFNRNDDFDFSMKILLSMIPALIIGLAFEDFIEDLFASSTLIYVGAFLCITALVLWFTPKENTNEKVTFPTALGIGVAQAIAILPGISRSGMTIATALYLGVDKARAARFSFLMLLPVIFGKVILDVVGGDLTVTTDQAYPVIAALISSFIVGIWACKWMIQIVKKSNLRYFAIYCLIVGLLVIGSYFVG
ncbi:MAG: undecaprenyl-diphosphate phosphatase [Saprospiraceae bacterium]